MNADYLARGNNYSKLKVRKMFPALKEWDAICEALGSGRQTIVIRKGGIAEGRQGFSFQHKEFVLLPTFFHQQRERVISEFAEALREEPENREFVDIQYTASLVWHREVRNREVLAKLEAYHILTPEEVMTRFEQNEDHGVQVALLRVYRLGAPCQIAWNKSFGGCRSWAQMEADIESLPLVSVLSDERFAEIESELLRILD